ncbi:MAG: ABC transporter permease [Chloroflexi bacterium]|nr:ABC transporter permease [Chloroflexota bacterium]
MSRIRRLIHPEQIRELSLLLVIIGVVIFFGSQIDNYYTPRTFQRISSSVMIIMVVAVGETMVVLTRNIDLSVSSIVGFTAYIAGQQVSQHSDMSPATLLALAVGLGAALGLINGLLVAYGNIPAIVVTLGTLAIYRGMLVQYGQAKNILVRDLPAWLVDLPRENLFAIGEVEIRLLFAVAVAIVIVFQLALIFLPFGRRLYAIGSNPDAAQMAGLPTRRIVLLAFVLCGALSGLGGFMYLSRIGTISSTAAQGLHMQVIAAVVVGGVNIFGGSGTMIGMMLGAILMGILEQSLIRMQINEFWKDAIFGLFILLAVATDALLMNRVRDLWARSAAQLHVARRATAHKE